MPRILIAGASRGLGLELARQYAADGWNVLAACRSPETADRVRAIGSDMISLHTIDVADRRSIKALAAELQGMPLDIVFANAGINEPPGITPETLDRGDWENVFAINTIAPVQVAAAFKPNLLLGEQKKAIAMSSLMGSIGRNNWGTQSIYRASKSALNALWRNLAIDWKEEGVICAVIRPGFVRTEMTGGQGEIDPETSVAGMREVLAGLTLNDSGEYHSWNGEKISW